MVLLIAPSDVGLPPGAGDVWAACQHTWYGWDGSEWDLSHGLSGLALQTGARGLLNAPVIRYSTKAPSVAGSLYRGVITDERDCFWPIKVWSDLSSQDWIDHNSRFWATLDEDQVGRWVVTQPSGRRRSLLVRYTGLADDSLDIDPGLVGWCVYGINLVAEQPFWFEDVIRRTFYANPDTSDYYGGASGGGYGPLYVTTVASTTDTATITNTGDVSAWPVYTAHGPYTALTVGVAGQTVTFPALSAGQWIRLNTDPTDQVAWDQAGVDRSAQLATADFAEIPKGANVPLTITMSGTGSVDVEITPKFRRAF